MGDGSAPRVAFAAFNQDASCFVAAASDGVHVFRTRPFASVLTIPFAHGIGCVEMLYSTNLLALVGGGDRPSLAPNRVVLWDDMRKQQVGVLTFREAVLAVRMRRDAIVVVLRQRLCVYDVDQLKLRHEIMTGPNARGLVAVSSAPRSLVLAAPAERPGQVRVELLHRMSSRLVPAHKTEIVALALNADGSLLATSSKRGTLIRVFDTTTCDLLKELRRGSQDADIYSLAFHPTNAFIACSSSRHTGHVWVLGLRDCIDADAAAPPTAIESEGTANRTSRFAFLRSVIPILGSEWSALKFKLPRTRTQLAFGPDMTVYAIGDDGTFRRFGFDPKTPGECQLLEDTTFFEPLESLTLHDSLSPDADAAAESISTSLPLVPPVAGADADARASPAARSSQPRPLTPSF